MVRVVADVAVGVKGAVERMGCMHNNAVCTHRVKGDVTTKSARWYRSAKGHAGSSMLADSDVDVAARSRM